MQKQIIKRVRTLIDLAREHYGFAIDLPEIRFDLRGRTAGQVRHRLSGRPAILRINVDLMERYPDRILDVTVPHETAHVVVRALWPRAKPHGREWQRVMRLFGIAEPSRTHNMQTRPARVHRKWVYRCGCAEHPVTIRIHRKVMAGEVYTCRKCGERIKQKD